MHHPPARTATSAASAPDRRTPMGNRSMYAALLVAFGGMSGLARATRKAQRIEAGWTPAPDAPRVLTDADHARLDAAADKRTRKNTARAMAFHGSVTFAPLG